MKSAVALCAGLLALSTSLVRAEDGPVLKSVLPATSWIWDKDARSFFGCAGGADATRKAAARTVCVALSCDYKSPTLTVLARGKPKSEVVALKGYAAITLRETMTQEEKDASKAFGMHARTLVLWGVKELGAFAVEGVGGSGLSVFVDGVKTDFALPEDGSAAPAFEAFHDECGFDIPG